MATVDGRQRFWIGNAILSSESQTVFSRSFKDGKRVSFVISGFNLEQNDSAVRREASSSSRYPYICRCQRPTGDVYGRLRPQGFRDQLNLNSMRVSFKIVSPQNKNGKVSHNGQNGKGARGCCLITNIPK